MILRIENVSFAYPSTPVLDGITLHVSRGEVIAVVGKNGAGKSTLLKCINHIIKPSAGAIYVNELDIEKVAFLERARTIGYLSQKSEQVFPMTVFEVVLMGRYPYSPYRFSRHDEEIVARILAQMELGGLANRTFDRLSGGEQQQVLIARALAQEADVLLFDEPTNNLDMRHQLEIMQLIRKVTKEEGKIALIAIHDLNLGASFADRVIIIYQNKIFSAGTPSEVFTEESLSQVFGVTVKIYNHNGIPHIVPVEPVSSLTGNSE